MKDKLSNLELVFAEIISQKNNINQELIIEVGLNNLWTFQS